MVNQMVKGRVRQMVKDRVKHKPPSRIRYEQNHPYGIHTIGHSLTTYLLIYLLINNK